MAKTLTAHNHGCFELIVNSLEKKSHSFRFGIIYCDIFVFLLKLVYCVYSLKSP